MIAKLPATIGVQSHKRARQCRIGWFFNRHFLKAEANTSVLLALFCCFSDVWDFALSPNRCQHQGVSAPVMALLRTGAVFPKPGI